jgi:hypothetical protein
MPAEESKKFTVKFGKEARAVHYEDSEGEIVFTFDVGSKFDFNCPSKHGDSICLEYHGSRATRDARYHLAFQRTKQYLDSCGYEVESYGG